MNSFAQAMGDEAEVEDIMEMSTPDLLKYVMAFPYYLTDSYYSQFREAIYERHDQLKAVR